MMKEQQSILIIDDDEDDRELFKEALQEIEPDIRCLSVHDGLSALILLDKIKILPDLIFLDLNMPRIDGKECLSRIKQNSRLQHIPIVIYSTSKIQEQVTQILNLGAADYIQKPAFFEDIKSEIALALQKHNVIVHDRL